MAKLNSVTKSFGDVKLISKAISFGFKAQDGLTQGTKKMLLHTHRGVVKSFTKNFDAKAPKTRKQAQTLAKTGRKYANDLAHQQPIDTGQLRGSVRHKSTGIGTGEVSMNKNYAVHVEYGTVKMAPRPVFRNGVSDVQEENRQILIAELNKKTV